MELPLPSRGPARGAGAGGESDAGRKRGRPSDGPSVEDEKREFQRRFDRTVAQNLAKKPYVSEFGKGRFVPEKDKGKDKPQKRVEVVRKKDERAALPGHACPECAKFYEAMVQQGIFTKENLPDMMKACSKHKAKYTPPDTPDGFWELSVNTPTQWKEEDERKKKATGPAQRR